MQSSAISGNTADRVIRRLTQFLNHGLNNCLFDLLKLQSVHSFLITCGFSHHSSFLTKLLFHCLSLHSFPSAYASSLFNQIQRPTVTSYNAFIRGFSSNSKNSSFLYLKMRRDGISPNKHTFPLLLKTISDDPFDIFTHIIKFGFAYDHFVRNSLLSAFARCGRYDCARQVFDEMTKRDIVAYTALIDGYLKNGRAHQALDLFLEMRVQGVGVDEVAIVSALRGVGILGYVWLGQWIHGFYIETRRIIPDVYVWSALVDMYSKCGYCEDAFRVFQTMPHRNIVSWSALLAGYVQWSRFTEALFLFQEMLVEKCEPNEATMVSVLTACAQLGALDQGRWVHKYIIARNLELNHFLGTALIDMYAKCGCIGEAFCVFEEMPVKDVYTFTALIFGLALNGNTSGCLNMFSRMVNSGVKPNEVTFVAVLSACSHGGHIDEGRRVFASMSREFGIQPSVDHYGCMVDLLGRSGRLEEAVELIEGMNVEPGAGVWGALFGACMIHKDFELGKIVGNHLIKLQPFHSGRYTLMANLYSKFGDWRGMADVRKKMNVIGIEKTPGCSWIESNGVLHEFIAFENSHQVSENVYGVLDYLTAHLLQLPETQEAHLLPI